MQDTYNGLPLPQDGQPIEYSNGQIVAPDHPIIPFIEGDGTGRDIWKASQRVFDAAIEKAYGGKRAIRWFEIFAGEKAFRQFGAWLPDDSVAAARDLRVSIKGPLTTPIGGGIRSLNVALRQLLDLYACVRPVKYYQGVPSPVKHPERVDIVIFRENTEDVYAGIEFKEGSPDAAKLIDFLNNDLLAKTKKQVRTDSGVGIKPISIFGSKRLVRYAIRHALETGRKTVTLVHKGNIQKFTEGAFRDWGYALAQKEFGAKLLDGGPWMSYKNPKTGQEIVVKDVITDAMLQQILLRPAEYDVIATLNLTGDLISDALAVYLLTKRTSGVTPIACPVAGLDSLSPPRSIVETIVPCEMNRLEMSTAASSRPPPLLRRSKIYPRACARLPSSIAARTSSAEVDPKSASRT